MFAENFFLLIDLGKFFYDEREFEQITCWLIFIFLEQPELKDTEERYRKSSTGKHNQDWRWLAVYPAEKKFLAWGEICIT